jgi:hypothetical protein
MLVDDVRSDPDRVSVPFFAIPALVQGCVERWWQCPTTLPDLGRRYTPSEQSAREARLSQLADGLGAVLDRPPQTLPAQRATQQRFVAEASAMAQFALGFEETEMARMRLPEFAEVMSEFARQARRFDPRLSAADIFQAGRNVLSANLLQLLLGRPIALTPAIFAYSLLYPYSDNVLDDPALSPAAKQEFNQRFRRRLAGQPLVASNKREEAVDRLVALVEGQYDRAKNPQVFASLLSIHSAQTRSLELMQRGAAPYEVDLLGVTFDKGGASVLADAYLAAGDLTAGEVTFAFELGAFLQLVDDLEDVESDLAAGRLSVYALAARHWRLDALTNRSLHFGAGVLAGLDRMTSPAAAGCRNFLQRGLSQSLILSAGRARARYSRGYERELEAHAPFRFGFVDRLARRLTRHMAAALPRLEAASADLVPAIASRDLRASRPVVTSAR